MKKCGTWCGMEERNIYLTWCYKEGDIQVMWKMKECWRMVVEGSV